MRLDSGRVESVLDDVKNARRVSRGEIQVRHDIPLLKPFLKHDPGDFVRCEKPTLRRGAGPAILHKAWPLCADRAICTATLYS